MGRTIEATVTWTCDVSAETSVSPSLPNGWAHVKVRVKNSGFFSPARDIYLCPAVLGSSDPAVLTQVMGLLGG